MSKIASNSSVPADGATIFEVASQRENRATFLLFVIFSIWIGYSIWLGFYNLYLSPLAKFPGPKLAALTGLYEAYFDLVKRGGGQFPFEIKKMHDKYGPIVRINPSELHIDDPEYYDVLYPTSKLYDKPARWEHRFGIPGSTFSTPRTEVHKFRRAAISPFFAKAKIREQTGQIQDLMDKISYRLSTEYANTDKILNIQDVWKCFAADNIMDLVFGHPLDLYKSSEFRSPFTVAITRVTQWSHVLLYFDWVWMILDRMPYWLAIKLAPPLKPVIEYRELIANRTSEIMASKREKVTEVTEETSFKTVFHAILASPDLPEPELSHTRLRHESESLIGAGFETTAWSLAIGTFHCIHNPDVYKKLKAELVDAMPDPDVILPWANLESLPYLNAVIKETLRVALGTAERLPRINRNGTWTYKDWNIPPGTIVGMDQYHMHTNDVVFGEPDVFRPERWLNDARGPDGIKPLTNYLTVFGKGSRMCVGLNLAYAEIYIGLATLFRRHDLELYETTPRDVEFYTENLIISPWPGSKGVRALVKK